MGVSAEETKPLSLISSLVLVGITSAPTLSSVYAFDSVTAERISHSSLGVNAVETFTSKFPNPEGTSRALLFLSNMIITL